MIVFKWVISWGKFHGEIRVLCHEPRRPWEPVRNVSAALHFICPDCSQGRWSHHQIFTWHSQDINLGRRPTWPTPVPSLFSIRMRFDISAAQRSTSPWRSAFLGMKGRCDFVCVCFSSAIPSEQWVWRIRVFDLFAFFFSSIVKNVMVENGWGFFSTSDTADHWWIYVGPVIQVQRLSLCSDWGHIQSLGRDSGLYKGRKKNSTHLPIPHRQTARRTCLRL